MNNRQSLYDKLIEYSENGRYAFHMPGHKRNRILLDGKDPFQIDITEIEDFDNLHHAEGIIKETMGNASQYFGTDKTWFLVNGSSGGILAAINSVTDIGDKIIVGRNCHKSVYNAAEIRNLDVEYLYPEYISSFGINGGYDPDKLKKNFIENENIKAVVVTSPTYDGIVSDIKKIAEITHENGAILIVDEAHGAHFGISESLPEPAHKLGADIVIESVHKTLPAMTQTALLHLCGNRVSADRVEECLGIYQSSSPSYVLMASIDKCINILQSEGRQLIDKLLITDKKFRSIVDSLKYIHVPGKELAGQSQVFDVDETKFVIYVEPNVCDGKELADILRKQYNFEMEMEAARYVLAITTICDDEEEIMRLAESLREIDKKLAEKFGESDLKKKNNKPKEEFYLPKSRAKCSIHEAGKALMTEVKIEESKGMISGEFVYLYPPGIPLLVPGEVISEEFVCQISEFKKMNMNINGLKDKENRYIRVIADKES